MRQDILLFHGALGSLQQFIELKELLSENFNVHVFNFSGHGGNPINQSFSIDLFGNDTLAFMQQSGIVHPSVFGYSMGGYVALKLALKHPDLFKMILTLGTKFEWTKESAEKEVKMLQHDIIEEKVPRFAQVLRERHTPVDWKTNMQHTADMMLALSSGDAMTTDDL